MNYELRYEARMLRRELLALKKKSTSRLVWWICDKGMGLALWLERMAKWSD